MKEEPDAEKNISANILAESKDPGRSVIVVSDLHLALDTCEHESPVDDFSDFIAFIQGLFLGGGTAGSPLVMVDEKPKRLFPPEKIILLGDIVDLWSPRNNSRASVLMDTFPVICPFVQFLSALGAEIVYVAGNHDDEIADFEDSFSVSGAGRLTILKRHWPTDSIESADGVKQYPGIKIGDHSYFFMHGHQFDLLFRAVGVLQNYPGWVSKNYTLFRENPGIKWFFRALLGATAIYAAAHAIFDITISNDWAIYILFGISLVIVLFSLNPYYFRKFWDIISGRKKSKDESIETLIENGFWKKDLGDNILADTVVFGHTHYPDDSKDRYLVDPINKRFINSGCWGDKINFNGKIVNRENTFVYIDAEGPVLFKWQKGGPPKQISMTLTGHFAGAGPSVSSITYWVRQNIWGRG